MILSGLKVGLTQSRTACLYSYRVRERSNRPVSDNHFGFIFPEPKPKLTHFQVEALSLCHAVVVTVVTACLPRCAVLSALSNDGHCHIEAMHVNVHMDT